jgi:hypothetical protein
VSRALLSAHLVEDLGQHRQDGLQVGARGDELQRHKVLQVTAAAAAAKQEEYYVKECKDQPGDSLHTYSAGPGAAKHQRQKGTQNNPTSSHLHDGLIVPVDQVADRLN